MAIQSTSDTGATDQREAKPSLSQYAGWLIRNGLATELDIHKNHYQAAVRVIEEKYRTSAFWHSILNGLKDVDAQYLVDHKYPLIAQFVPELLIKSWPSFIEKTYRKNILSNADFPNAPAEGWVTPDNWYAKVRDIVRTTIVVKYLDGVPLLVEFLRQKAAEHGLEFQGGLEARVDGYYGGQCFCGTTCEMPALDWTITETNISMEIQVTTSMKDVIKRLLHSYYETRRIEFGPPSQIELSWNYKSEEFIATYLGHILHYVEGMILDVRDRKRG